MAFTNVFPPSENVQHQEGHRQQTSEPRVLFVATMAVTVRAFLLPIAEHFRAKGWRVDAMANGIDEDAPCRSAFDRVWSADWTRNPIDPRNFKMARQVRQCVSTHGYDIVHVHTPVASFMTRFALDHLRSTRNLKVIYTAHGFHFYPGGSALRNKVFEALERQAAKWTDFLIVMNREDLAAAKDNSLISRDRVRYMPGIGVDRSRYSISSVSPRDVNKFYLELGIEPDCPVLLMLAEFVERKRHADAIRAFSKVVHPRAHFVCAGAGPLLERMKSLAAQLGAANQVHFLGARYDVPVLLKAARALVLPSSQEGLPRSVLEALSMGIPVIGSRIRGTTELLEQSAGLLVNVGDIDALRNAMQVVLDDPEAASAMGRIGRQQSEAYDLSRILHLHEDLYEEALGLR